MSDISQNILRKYSTEEIYTLIKNDILSLRIKPGQALSENELAKQYGVSRTPIHNILGKLNNEEMVEIYPQRGTYVSLLDKDFIKQILYLRVNLESELLIEASKCCNDIFIKKIENSLEQQKKLINIDNLDGLEYYEQSDMFHSLFYEMTGKKKLWEKCIVSMQSDYTRYRVLMFHMENQRERAYEEHKKLANMVINHDLKDIKSFLSEHLLTRFNEIDLGKYKDYFY